ncbi:hypothetical protein GOP47_0024960 [Adiantum capillus-veneris]|uniref:Uncharacterized protein n=1 Tax=Adiantum capillus-veneris TaxID=13818 RepID=A0A9D4U3T3_ADICA|nr:hypothetical protein GOP47_0024960 [Adiantum capillus-veneris]
MGCPLGAETVMTHFNSYSFNCLTFSRHIPLHYLFWYQPICSVRMSMIIKGYLLSNFDQLQSQMSHAGNLPSYDLKLHPWHLKRTAIILLRGSLKRHWLLRPLH